MGASSRTRELKGEFYTVIQKLKEMEYRKEPCNILLAHGEYCGHLFKIINRGAMPCCYVSISAGKAICMDDISCHGGITWVDGHLPGEEEPNPNIWWIGWDYAHYGDYLGYFSDFGGKKWTLDELIEDCMSVIGQLEEWESDGT